MDIFPRHCMVWIILLLSDRVCSLSALKVLVQWPCFLRKQPTLHVATTGFRTKQYQRNQCWNSILMACHYQDWLVLVIRLLPIVLALFLLFFGFASIFFYILSQKALLALFWISTDYLYNFVLKSTIWLYLCRPKPHFALILVKGAEEAWGIGLIGQRLPSRNPVHTRSKMASSTLSSRSNGSQPARAEIARESTLPFCCWKM